MKKVFLLAALLVASMSMMAEKPQSAMNQVVWHNGKVMYGSPIPTVDSITFAAEIESSDTLHLILPRTIIKEVHDTTIKEVIKEVIVEVHDTIIKKVYQCPEEPLTGVFSVSADKQVRFSKGNLQYTQSTDTWAFAENQYDMLGTANIKDGSVSHDFTGDKKSGTTLSDRIDLFGWSANNTTAVWGISTSVENSDYYGDFVDWGINMGNGYQWRTLTNDEWTYLRNNRENAASLIGIARININDVGTEYVNGLIILPDNWICPVGSTFNPGFASVESEIAYANHQTIPLSDWHKLEMAGAIFLPASGFRSGAYISRVQYDGSYWSSTPNSIKDGFSLNFLSTGIDSGKDYRSDGQSVRLVQDL